MAPAYALGCPVWPLTVLRVAGNTPVDVPLGPIHALRSPIPNGHLAALRVASGEPNGIPPLGHDLGCLVFGSGETSKSSTSPGSWSGTGCVRAGGASTFTICPALSASLMRTIRHPTSLIVWQHSVLLGPNRNVIRLWMTSQMKRGWQCPPLHYLCRCS